QAVGVGRQPLGPDYRGSRAAARGRISHKRQVRGGHERRGHLLRRLRRTGAPLPRGVHRPGPRNAAGAVVSGVVARTIRITPPAQPRDVTGTIELAPGEAVVFGRAVPEPRRAFTIADPAVSRVAGEIRAAENYWLLSNFSTSTTYVVENPEGGGEYVK